MNFRNLREKAGMTREKTAFAMGVSVSTVVRWDSGDSIPDIKQFAKLREIFGKDADKLLESEASA